MSKIDFVVLWVDGSDQEWLKEKSLYSKSEIDIAEEAVRFRDWDLLRYWFRGVEKFAPWVRKVHFITYGHLPEWLNTENDKLNLVYHKDYIPEKYLPTFSSHTIEFNIHKIKGLSEKFILFNDDFYITKPIYEEDFFIDEKPVDMMILSALSPLEDVFSHILYNNIEEINKKFSRKDFNQQSFNKKFNLKYKKNLIKTFTALPYKNIIGFYNQHLAQPFLKKTFNEVWGEIPDRLNSTCMNKFRDEKDINQYLIRYWNLLKGNFVPGEEKGKYIELSDNNIEYVKNIIRNKKYKVLALNDSIEIKNFDNVKEELRKAFDIVLPDKSSFEK